MDFTVQTLINTSADPVEWNQLAEKNGNYFQSTYSDQAQAYYKQVPVYFEARNNGRLVGGVKIYVWESRKYGGLAAGISRTTIQLSEILSSLDTGSGEFAIMKTAIKKNLLQFLKQKKVTEYITAGIYGNEALLIELDQQPDAVHLFNSAYVDLDKPIEEIIAGFNRNTQRNIKKAQTAGVHNDEEKNIEEFLKVLNVVYAQQNPPQHAPNNDFIRHIFKTLDPINKIDVHLAKLNGEALSSSFFVKFGQNAYSWFGGSLKNEAGAGQFIYLELMKKYQQQGIKRFYFGEVAREDMIENEKFSKGISNFKRGFGLVELNSFKKTYILSRTKKKLWELLLKVKK